MNINKEIIDNYKLLSVVVKDNNKNIVFSNLKSSLSLGEELVTGEYYNKKTKKWYLIDIYEKDNYTFEYILDITRFKQREEELKKDCLTLLDGRKAATDKINNYISEAKRNDEEFAIVIADVDDLKKVNDTYGHDYGDETLKTISKTMKDNIRHSNERPQDIIGRIGGDEFVIVIKNITNENSKAVIEQIRNAVENCNIQCDIKPTVSFGVYHVSKYELEEVDDVKEFRFLIMKKADTALYESKASGKNKSSDYVKKNKLRG